MVLTEHTASPWFDLVAALKAPLSTTVAAGSMHLAVISDCSGIRVTDRIRPRCEDRQGKK